MRLSADYEAPDGCDASSIDADAQSAAAHTFERLGAQGYRALGIASRAVDRTHDTAGVTDETDLTFSGFAVFLDPPKASAGGHPGAGGGRRRGQDADRRQRAGDPPRLRRDRRARSPAC